MDKLGGRILRDQSSPVRKLLDRKSACRDPARSASLAKPVTPNTNGKQHSCHEQYDALNESPFLVGA
jgi:hypothetical protein